MEIPTDKDECAALIETMLQAVEADIDEYRRPNEFIESLRDQFDRRGWLSDKQVEALMKFYDRVV